MRELKILIHVIKHAIKIALFGGVSWNTYLWIVFFIVLDLRLTKDWSKALLQFLF